MKQNGCERIQALESILDAERGRTGGIANGGH